MESFVKTSVVLFGIKESDSDNYRKLSNKKLSVLLVKKDENYYLPTYVCNEVIDLDEQSVKAVSDDTGLMDLYVEQLYTYSSVKDSNLFINPTFLGLISKEKMYKGLKNNCYWCDLNIVENSKGYECELVNEIECFKFSVTKKLKKHTTDRYKFYEENNSKLGENVSVILISAFERLRNKVNYTDIVFNMMGDNFTLKELQQVYETILNKSLLDAAFRRIISSKVEETNEILKGIGCRPSKLYRYRGNSYENRE